MTTKTAVLTSQIKRAIRIGSNEETKNKGLKLITDLFLKNGYPPKLIKNSPEGNASESCGLQCGLQSRQRGAVLGLAGKSGLDQPEHAREEVSEVSPKRDTMPLRESTLSCVSCRTEEKVPH